MEKWQKTIMIKVQFIVISYVSFFTPFFTPGCVILENIHPCYLGTEEEEYTPYFVNGVNDHCSLPFYTPLIFTS